MNWGEISNSIQDLYSKKEIEDKYSTESQYLEKAFFEIEELWEIQFEKIKTVKYVLLSEAPLWSEKKKYMYNPQTALSQFFYKNDLETVLNRPLSNKTEFLKALSELGLIILDLSPFPLNEVDTSINYRKISKKDYSELVKKAAPHFILEKLNQIKAKANGDTSFFFRYTRVKNLFEQSMKEYIKQTGFTISDEPMKDIAQMGGGIDRKKLKKIITQANNG